MDNILKEFKVSKNLYDKNMFSLAQTRTVVNFCLAKLKAEADLKKFGLFNGKPSIQYYVFSQANNLSRPIRKQFFILDVDEFNVKYEEFVKKLIKHDTDDQRFEVLSTEVIYTSVISFAACIDLWKPKSRKIPGTFFEVLFGGLFREFLPNCVMSKFIKIEETAENDEGSVSTDLVLNNEATGLGAVIPLKITTRERIVQAFAHQRILSSSFPDKYASFLACISETQRDDKSRTVKQICVPGTVKLYQKHLSAMSGIYYADVPQRYAQKDLTDIIPVKLIGSIFNDVRRYICND